MTIYTVVQTVRVRSGPSLTAADLLPQGLPIGTKINVLETKEVGGYKWGRHLVQCVGTEFKFSVWSAISRNAPKFSWMTSQVNVPIVVTPPVVTPPNGMDGPWPAIPASETRAEKARRYLGVHDLCCAGASDAADHGCDVVKVFEDATGAIQLAQKYPKKLVIHRKYFVHAPSPEELVAQHGIDPNVPNQNHIRILIEAMNESDSPGFATGPDDIRRQFAYESRMVELIERAAPNSRVLGFNKSHGTPNFLDPEVVKAIKETYAPLYNQGRIWIGLHNYWKAGDKDPKDFKFYDPIWFERRADWLFTHCGFDPKIRHILPSEAGGESWQGGMAHVGFSESEYDAWADYYMDVMDRPIVVNGVSYPSPYRGSTQFQYRGAQHNRWVGYEITQYMNTLRRRWAGVNTRGLEHVMKRSVDLLHGGNEPDPNYVPAPKPMK